MPTPIEEQPWGPDVSHHNGRIDWIRVAERGASFAFVKVGQGATMTDPAWERNWREARRATLLVGRYFFLDYDHPAEMQARRFYDMCGGARKVGELPRVVDCENDSDDVPPIKQRTPLYMARAIGAFMEEYHRVAGEYPMIYTYPSFWYDTLGHPDTYAKSALLWMADYSFKRPRLAGGWPYHTFHQYTDRGVIQGARLVPGVGRADLVTDLNRFNGSAERLPLLAAK